MGKKAFTLLEVMVVVVVIGISVTLGMPIYQNIVEGSKAKVCESNLKALKASLDIYAMENDNMPASLSQIPQEYIERAYARIFKEKDAWKLKLAKFIVACQQKGYAYAAFLRDNLAKGNMGLITCPKDSSPSASHGSYGLNADLAGKSSQYYRNLAPGTLLISDCDNAEFHSSTDLSPRHKVHSFPFTATAFWLAISKNGDIIRADTQQGSFDPCSLCESEWSACLNNNNCISAPHTVECYKCEAEYVRCLNECQ